MVRARRYFLLSGKPLRDCLRLTAVWLILYCLANSAWGDDLLDGFDRTAPEDSGNDTVLDGFEDAGTQIVTGSDDVSTNPSASRKLPVRLNGSASLAASYNFAHKPPRAGGRDWRGLSRLRAELALELDVRPADSWRTFVSGKAGHDFAYAVNGREDYTDDVLDAYEDELELWETYVQGSISKRFDLKVGRQIVVWGVSDNIRVVDVINPLDLREPGITDIEDLRLPVCMTKLDYYWGHFNFSGIAVHEVRFNKNPPYGSDFYPAEESAPEEIPGSSPDNTRLAFSLSGIFSGWDLAVYWADIYYADTYLSHQNIGTSSFPKQIHPRIQMFGSAADIAVGNWLIKAEVAWLDGLKFTNSPETSYSRLDLLAGAEYTGFTDTQITFEMVDRHLFDHTRDLENEPDRYDQDQFQWVMRVERDFLHASLTLTMLASVCGTTGNDGAFQRFTAAYDITDNVQITGGVICYQSGDQPFYGKIGDNDRFYLKFTYGF